MIFNKRGDTSVFFIISLILVVIIIVFAAVEVKWGFVKVEQIGEIADNIISSFNFWKGGMTTVCSYDDASGFVDGKTFIKDVGLNGAEVKIGRCNDGSCELKINEINFFRVSDGNFEKSFGDSWIKYNVFFEEDISEIEKEWKIYNEVDRKLKELKVNEIYNEKFSEMLVFYGNGEGLFDSPIYAFWQDGQWLVFNEGVKKDVLYNKEDTNEALGIFVEQVYSGRFSNDDKVYWKVLPSDKLENTGGDLLKTYSDAEKVDRTLTILQKLGMVSAEGDINIKVLSKTAGVQLSRNAGRESLEDPNNWDSIGTLIGDEKQGSADMVDVLYDALVCAEHRNAGCSIKTGTLKEDYNPWIRTKDNKCVPQSNGDCYYSSAYGPAQLTKSLADGFLKKKDMEWTQEEKDYLNRFIDQGNNFLSHSMGSSAKDSVYGFGGTGTLTSNADKAMYEQVVKKIIKKNYESNNNNPEAVWREWRFGKAGMSKEDIQYEIFFMTIVHNKQEASYGGTDGDFDEIDSDREVAILKERVGKMINEMSLKIAFSDDDIVKMKSAVDGQTISVDGVEYTLELKDSGNNKPVVGVVSGEEKFDLVYDANMEDDSWSFYKLRTDFPFRLLRMCPGAVLDCDRNIPFYYRLSKENFQEVKLATLTNRFIRTICR